ncbi:MAG TPA: hypothetical protein VIE13_04650 [Terriglobales bacterium]|jgi:hypothetical protein
MSFDLDNELRQGLGRVAPRRDLTAGVLARLGRRPPRRAAAGWRTWAAAVAGLALVVVSSFGWWQARRTAQARADAQQLVAALQMASAHLERARSQVVRMSQ